MFISAETQAKANGPVLEMDTTVERLKQAGEQLRSLSGDAQMANADPADVQAQLDLLKKDLDQLKASVLLLSSPQGIALTSGKHLQLAAHEHAQALAHAHKQTFDHADVGLAPGVEHQVEIGRAHV